MKHTNLKILQQFYLYSVLKTKILNGMDFSKGKKLVS